MNWDEDLTDEQKAYASCDLDGHSVLIAGPGTGKTFTIVRKVAYMISEKKISPEDILIVTFTRAAAAELSQRLKEFLGNEEKMPYVSTLHSFAFRQLVLNQELIANYQLPTPIRVVDDWEENNLIFEELKDILECDKQKIKEKFLELSADWDTLKADEDRHNNDRFTSNFLGVWNSHRKTYTYILRSELVYQVKKSIEQIGDFKLEKDFKYILIDEFQDLNRCDLGLIYALRDQESNICGIGDDDQSIYGFRFAYPDGIRNFKENFSSADMYKLMICQRCDKNIIKLSQLVADLDKDRVPKKLKPKEDAEDGEIHLYRFKNQFYEAKGISKICKTLIHEKKYSEDDILILLRIDSKQKFSDIIKNALEKEGIAVSNQNQESSLDKNDGRLLISILRLINEFNDSLALRTILHLRKDNNIGIKTISKIYNLALQQNKTFVEIIEEIAKKPTLIPTYGKRIKIEIEYIKNIVNKFKRDFINIQKSTNVSEIKTEIQKLAEFLIENKSSCKKILDFLFKIIDEREITNLNKIFASLNSSLREMEQEKEKGKINIITMHKAKGLTAKAIIIVGAEQEFIPGRQQQEPDKFDELRLLFVSISRAKHFLAITYCDKRIGQQTYSGSDTGKPRRHLTEFLQNCKMLSVENGDVLLK